MPALDGDLYAVAVGAIVDATALLLAAADDNEHAEIRDYAALQRDRAADERDQLTARRDRADVARDNAHSRGPLALPLSAATVRERDARRRADNAMMRDLAAIDRTAAAADRELARLDRLRAGADRATLVCQLELLHAIAISRAPASVAP